MKNKILNVFVLLSFLLILLPRGYAQNTASQGSAYSQEDLDNLVGPIALYPDPLLAQILPASTYPLEIVAAARIIHGPKDFSKIDSQNWDPSVKAVAHYPDVLKMMNEKLDWTQQLGQAVLAQQQDVLQSVQNLRQQAQQVGNLKTNKQQIVRSSGTNIIEVMPASPQVIYVPTYDPQIVYTTPLVQVYTPVIHIGPAAVFASLFYAGFYWSNYSLVCGESYHWHRDRGWYNPYSAPVNVTNINNTYNTNNTSVSNTNVNNTNVNNTYVNNSKNYDNPRPQAWSHDNYHGNPMRGGLPSRSDLRPTYTRSFKNNFPENNHEAHPVNDSGNRHQGSVYVPQGSSNFSGNYAKGRSWVPQGHNHNNDSIRPQADFKPISRPVNVQNITPSVNSRPVAMNVKSPPSAPVANIRPVEKTAVEKPVIEKQGPPTMQTMQGNKMRGLLH